MVPAALKQLFIAAVTLPRFTIDFRFDHNKICQSLTGWDHSKVMQHVLRAIAEDSASFQPGG